MSGTVIKRQLLRVGSLALDLERLCVDAGSGPVPLRPKSFDVLRHLMKHAGRVVPKQELIAAVWPGVTVSDESLAQCISDVRHAIGDEAKELIRTIPKRGYVIDGPLAAEGPVTAEMASDAAGGASSAGARCEQELDGGVLGALRKSQTVGQRSTSRSFVLAGFAAAVVMGVAVAAGAISAALGPSTSSREGLWQGVLTCDKLPFTSEPLVTHIAVNVSGAAASYSRRVLSPHLSSIMGVEEGSGTIDPTGAIRLTGGWALEPRIRFAASYSGMLAAQTAELRGTQVFTGSEGELTRNCSIKLSR